MEGFSLKSIVLFAGGGWGSFGTVAERRLEKTVCGSGAILGVEKMYRLRKGRVSLFMTALPVGENIFLPALRLQGRESSRGGGIALQAGRIPFFKGVQSLFQVLGMPFARKRIVIRGRRLKISLTCLHGKE